MNQSPTLQLFAITFVLAVLAGCGEPQGVQAPRIAASGTASISGANGRADTRWLRSLPASAILIQSDYEPTAWDPHAMRPFGRLPPFTLYADGRLIYVDEGRPSKQTHERAMEAHLSPEERVRLLREVVDLGWDRLETYTEQSQPTGDGGSIGVTDSAYTILKVRRPGAALREVRIYDDFGTDPDALRAIRSLLGTYRHPKAEEYVPDKAVLFVQPTSERRGDVFCSPVEEWPLAAETLKPPAPRLDEWAVVVGGAELAKLVRAHGRAIGHGYYRRGDRIYNVGVIPWLPGADYTREVRSYRVESAPDQSLSEGAGVTPTSAPQATAAGGLPTAGPEPTPTLDPDCYVLP